MLVYTIPASNSVGWSDETGVYYADNTTNGAYYGWCATTAGTCLQGTNAEVKDKDAPCSICPRGWKLPTRAQYDTLVGKKTGSWNSGWTLGGGFFPAAGYFGTGSLNGVGSHGYYWSSTAYGSNHAYGLSFASGGVGTDPNGRYDGNSIRCIAP